MKYLALAAFLLSAGCVTQSEFDEEAAFARCQSINDIVFRDRCIAEAVAKSESEGRDTAAAETGSDEEEAE